MKMFPKQETLKVSEVPEIFHAIGIIKGYRKPCQPIKYYAASIFTIHNETLNIWTHLIGAFFICFVMAEYNKKLDFASNEQSWPIVVFGVCAIFTQLFSALAHLFYPKSESCNYYCWMIDYIGVNLNGYGCGIQAFYIHADQRMYEQFEPYFLQVLFLLCLFAYSCTCYADLHHSSFRRKVIMIGGYTTVYLLMIIVNSSRYVACYVDNECSLSSLNHIVIQFLLYAVQAFFFVSHLPERLFPGKFDIVGHSHQLFHVTITITIWYQIWAMYYEIQAGHARHTNPEISLMFAIAIMLVLVQILIMLFAKRILFNRSKKNN